MNASANRNFLANVMIVLGVCVAVWYFGVRPQVLELKEIERKIATQNTQSSVTPQAVEQAVKRVNASKARIAEIESFNQLANDSSRLYGLVIGLADAHGVQVKSLQPRTQGLIPDDAQVITTRVDLIVEGKYERVAAFFDAVNRIDAFVRPVSLQMSPTSNSSNPIVIASLGCNVMSFPIPAVLSGASGDSDAKR